MRMMSWKPSERPARTSDDPPAAPESDPSLLRARRSVASRTIRLNKAVKPAPTSIPSIGSVCR
jgi:hypothetical protein